MMNEYKVIRISRDLYLKLKLLRAEVEQVRGKEFRNWEEFLRHIVSEYEERVFGEEVTARGKGEVSVTAVEEVKK